WRPLCGQSFNATGFTADHYSILEAATPCISKLFN
ncbi:Non-ribosomal peptide synthetase, terminal component, partial [Pseudomonas syringae pv. maculicola]